MIYKAYELSLIMNAQLQGNKNQEVENICIDSRNIYSADNSVFFAIKTNHNDGHKYIENAIERGIKVVVCENFTSVVEGVTFLIVENSVKALQKWAKFHLGKFHLNSIGITGSNGKTVVKEWLYQCLWQKMNLVKSPKSYNSQIGLSLSLLQIDAHHDLGIFEVGISEPNEMRILKEIFSPKIGIFTHLGSAHSENFLSKEQIIDEKLILFEKSELIIFNGDLELVKEKIEKTYPNKRKVSYGVNQDNDLQILVDKNSKKVEINYFGERFTMEIENQSDANLHNVLAVIAVLKELKINNYEIINSINELKSVEMRMESVLGIQNNTLINDSYNLDLDSLVIALEHIKSVSDKEKTLILSDIISVKLSNEILYLKVAKMINLLGFNHIYLIGNEITKYNDMFYGNVNCFETTKELIDSQKLLELHNQLILLKGARKFEFEIIQKKLELQSHDSVLLVNLDSLIHNINIHKTLLKSTTKIMAMVKAYSYGLGDYEIAKALQNQQIDYLGVAYADEGVVLRQKGIRLPIMVMNPDRNSFSQIIDYSLEPEIYSIRTLELFLEQIRIKGINKIYPIHIKLDTGMNRLGFREKELDELIKLINNNQIKIQSIFSHLSSSDDINETEFTLKQINIFNKLSDQICKNLDYSPIKHILNSSGICNFPDYQMDMVRIGIGMLGISSNQKIQNKLKSVVSFKTIISQVKNLEKGECISYNRKYVLNKNQNIATIPLGYADGIPRLLGNEKASFYINNKAFPIVGNICMDMLMLNLGSDKINEEEEVFVFSNINQLIEYAKASQTIAYEALTSISKRVKRIYIYD